MSTPAPRPRAVSSPPPGDAPASTYKMLTSSTATLAEAFSRACVSESRGGGAASTIPSSAVADALLALGLPPSAVERAASTLAEFDSSVRAARTLAFKNGDLLPALRPPPLPPTAAPNPSAHLAGHRRGGL